MNTKRRKRPSKLANNGWPSVLNQPGKRKSRRGFAVMKPATVQRIAALGGKAIARNRKHMANIGRIGGSAPHVNRHG